MELFIVPDNDGEAVEIQKILQANGREYLVTGQRWGASWEGLEPEIKERVNNFEGTIYGIELQGIPLGCKCKNIDHQRYSQEDDRTNSLSSLEQIARILNVNLTQYQEAVSDNDKGYIDLMKRNGYAQSVINKVRLQDRTAQGITKEEERQAEQVLKSLEVQGTLTIVHLLHSKCATVTDRLYGKYTNLLIVCGNGEVDFYGEGSICLELQSKFGGWSGGQLPQYGFWGGYVDKDEVVNFLKNRC